MIYVGDSPEAGFQGKQFSGVLQVDGVWGKINRLMRTPTEQFIPKQ